MSLILHQRNRYTMRLPKLCLLIRCVSPGPRLGCTTDVLGNTQLPFLGAVGVLRTVQQDRNSRRDISQDFPQLPSDCRCALTRKLFLVSSISSPQNHLRETSIVRNSARQSARARLIFPPKPFFTASAPYARVPKPTRGRSRRHNCR